MLQEKIHAYNASFTTGALMLHESRVIIPLLLSGDTEGVKREINVGEALKLNAFASRRKKVGEITKRFKHVKPIVWQRFIDSEEQEQLLILYYACLKTYNIMKDFQIDFLLKKWLNYSLEYDKYVFLDFLFRQSATHPEIDAWTDETKDKLSSVVNVMLTEVGLLKEGKLKELNIKEAAWQQFALLNEYWFMEALFMSDEQRQTISQNI
jgi:hypothetical protein